MSNAPTDSGDMLRVAECSNCGELFLQRRASGAPPGKCRECGGTLTVVREEPWTDAAKVEEVNP